MAGRDSIFYWEEGRGEFFANWSIDSVKITTGKWIGESCVGQARYCRDCNSEQCHGYIILGILSIKTLLLLSRMTIRRLAAIWCFCSSPIHANESRKLDRIAEGWKACLSKCRSIVENWHRSRRSSIRTACPNPTATTRPNGSSRAIPRARPTRSRSPWPVCSAIAGRTRSRTISTHSPTRTASYRSPPCGAKPPAAERLREVLRTAFGSEWSASLEHKLLTEAGASSGTTLDDWLRNSFFEQHCKRFHQRPFVWHVWDGRKDGFSCLVNYHKLTHKLLDNLTYSYVQDWINLQAADARSGKPGADLRLAAAQALQEKLKLILAGEPPYDIFVRWKPLAEQPIGWNPDLNDGVRMNIRPFVEAGHSPKAPEHQVDQGPGQGTRASQGGVSLVLERRQVRGRPRQRYSPDERPEAGCEERRAFRYARAKNQLML